MELLAKQLSANVRFQQIVLRSSPLLRWIINHLWITLRLEWSPETQRWVVPRQAFARTYERVLKALLFDYTDHLVLVDKVVSVDYEWRFGAGLQTHARLEHEQFMVGMFDIADQWISNAYCNEAAYSEFFGCLVLAVSVRHRAVFASAANTFRASLVSQLGTDLTASTNPSLSRAATFSGLTLKTSTSSIVEGPFSLMPSTPGSEQERTHCSCCGDRFPRAALPLADLHLVECLFPMQVTQPWGPANDKLILCDKEPPPLDMRMLCAGREWSVLDQYLCDPHIALAETKHAVEAMAERCFSRNSMTMSTRRRTKLTAQHTAVYALRGLHEGDSREGERIRRALRVLVIEALMNGSVCTLATRMQSILGCELASTLRMLVRMVEEDTSGGGFEDQLDDKQKPALDTLPCLNDVVPEPRSIALCFGSFNSQTPTASGKRVVGPSMSATSSRLRRASTMAVLTPLLAAGVAAEPRDRHPFFSEVAARFVMNYNALQKLLFTPLCPNTVVFNNDADRVTVFTTTNSSSSTADGSNLVPRTFCATFCESLCATAFPLPSDLILPHWQRPGAETAIRPRDSMSVDGLAAYSNFGDAHWDRQRPLFRSQVAATATRCLAIEDSVTLLAPIPLTETTVQMDCVPSVRHTGNISTRKRALVVMGMQNDFLLSGAVSVGGALSLIPLVNAIRSDIAFDLVALTQVSHPSTHCSFLANHSDRPEYQLHQVVHLPGVGAQLMRPVHCVTDTPGFNFHSELTRGLAGELVVPCGGDASLDSRSAFYDGRHKRKTTLDKALKTAGVVDVYLCGLALDTMLGDSALDAVTLGYTVYVIQDACREINVEAASIMLNHLRSLDVHMIQSVDLYPAPLLAIVTDADPAPSSNVRPSHLFVCTVTSQAKSRQANTPTSISGGLGSPVRGFGFGSPGYRQTQSLAAMKLGSPSHFRTPRSALGRGPVPFDGGVLGQAVQGLAGVSHSTKSVHFVFDDKVTSNVLTPLQETVPTTHVPNNFVSQHSSPVSPILLSTLGTHSNMLAVAQQLPPTAGNFPTTQLTPLVQRGVNGLSVRPRTSHDAARVSLPPARQSVQRPGTAESTVDLSLIAPVVHSTKYSVSSNRRHKQSLSQSNITTVQTQDIVSGLHMQRDVVPVTTKNYGEALQRTLISAPAVSVNCKVGASGSHHITPPPISTSLNCTIRRSISATDFVDNQGCAPDLQKKTTLPNNTVSISDLRFPADVSLRSTRSDYGQITPWLTISPSTVAITTVTVSPGSVTQTIRTPKALVKTSILQNSRCGTAVEANRTVSIPSPNMGNQLPMSRPSTSAGAYSTVTPVSRRSDLYLSRTRMLGARGHTSPESPLVLASSPSDLRTGSTRRFYSSTPVSVGVSLPNAVSWSGNPRSAGASAHDQRLIGSAKSLLSMFGLEQSARTNGLHSNISNSVGATSWLHTTENLSFSDQSMASMQLQRHFI